MTMAVKAQVSRAKVAELVKKSTGVQPAFLGPGGDGTAIVDLETGRVSPSGPAGEKLNDAGKMRLAQMIVAGDDGTTIAKALVSEGFVLSYTPKAVEYWREKPEIQLMLGQKSDKAFQVGLASRVQRVNAHKELAEALRDSLLMQSPTDPNKMVLRTTQSQQSQAMIIKVYLETLKAISELIDDFGPSSVTNVAVAGDVNVTQAQMIGLSSDGKPGDMANSLMARLREANTFIEGQFTTDEGKLPKTLINGQNPSNKE